MTAKPRKKTHCKNCGKFVLVTETVKSPGGGLFCVECFNENYRHCDYCDAVFHNSDAKRAPSGSIYCPMCFDRMCIKCNTCGSTIWRNASYYDPDGNRVCVSCYEDTCFECYDCGDVFWTDDCREDGGDLYCASCYSRVTSDYGDFDAVPFAGVKNYSAVGSERKFGVEIETADCPKFMELANKICFDAKDDCSVAGKEFASSILYGNDGLAAIKNLCAFAEKNDWSVDSHCGLHIHLDMSNESTKALRAITAAYYLTYDVWKQFVESRRVGNHYCARSYGSVTSLDDTPRFATYAMRQNRYEWLNLNAYSKFRTFEIRLHHGSIDGEEICNWIRAHAIFVDWAAQLSLRKVKEFFENMSKDEKFEFVSSLWKSAGCGDLADYYQCKLDLGLADCAA